MQDTDNKAAVEPTPPSPSSPVYTKWRSLLRGYLAGTWRGSGGKSNGGCGYAPAQGCGRSTHAHGIVWRFRAQTHQYRNISSAPRKVFALSQTLSARLRSSGHDRSRYGPGLTLCRYCACETSCKWLSTREKRMVHGAGIRFAHDADGYVVVLG